MGADRVSDGTDTNAETVEEQPDRRPPPPPDKPGTDGYPSRADSRNGAAAANDTGTGTGTGTQNTEKQAEEKPDSAQTSQETSGEQGSSATEKPEPPGTLEYNEGAVKDDSTTERYDNGPSPEGAGGKSDRQPTEEIGEPKDADQREQALEGQTSPHDRTTITETGKGLRAAGATERAEQNGAGEKSPTDDTKSEIGSPPSAVDIGDRPASAVEQTEDAFVSAPDTPGPPRDSFDAPGDVVGGDTRESTRPADDTAEPAARPPEIEGQPQSADKSQPDSRDQALPAADAKQNADQASDGHHEKADPAEATEGLGAPLTESAGADGDRIDLPDGADELEIKSEAAPKDVDTTGKQALSERLMVDGVPLHKYLDPVGAAAWSNESVDVEPNPAGDRIADLEKDELSRFEKMRRKAYEASDDIHDIVQDRLNEAKDIFAQPPTGHTEIGTHPEVIPAPHDGISIGDAATALVAAGVVVGEVFRRRRGKLIDKKGK
jgi:hypothetical protein